MKVSKAIPVLGLLATCVFIATRAFGPGEPPLPPGTSDILPPDPTTLSADEYLAEATRRIVAWIVEGRPLPDNESPYADSTIMQDKEQFLVVCDYLPPETVVSTDPRARRVTMAEKGQEFSVHGHEGWVYVTIDWVEVGASDDLFGFVLENDFGYLAGQAYKIVISRRDGKEKAEIQGLWVK